jgi:hypothetical protein
MAWASRAVRFSAVRVRGLARGAFCELVVQVEDFGEGSGGLVGAPGQIGEERGHRRLPAGGDRRG